LNDLPKAPSLTPDDIEATIANHYFHVIPGTTMTLCALTLRNGFIVTGTSAAVSPENFDAAMGREIAHRNAVDQIWQLEGYLLKQRLYEMGSGADSA